MKEFIGPLQGFVIGFLLIIFRNKISFFLQQSVKKFPKYKDGEKTFNLNYSVKPIFILILGAIFITIAFVGSLTKLNFL